MAQVVLYGSGEPRGIAAELDEAVSRSGASVELVSRDEAK